MILGILLGFSFIIYTNSSPKRKDKSIIYLNFFVLFFTLNNLQITLADYNYIDLNFFERKLLIPFYALIIPAFYTFVSYYLKVEKQIKSFVIISSVLFFIEIIVRIAFATQYYNDKSNYIVAKYAQLEEIVNLIYTIFLFLKVVYFFMNQSKLYENIASFDNMKWLKKFLLYGFLILLLWVFAITFNLKDVISPNIPVYYPLRFSSSLIIFWIAYHGFFKYNLLTERIELRKEIANDNSQKELYKIESTNKSFLIIQNYIIEKKLYLETDLYVEIVAKEINFSSNKVSETIKEITKHNFPDYINALRIEKAKKYLISKKHVNYTIVAIGLECGFNSKTTFYNAFNKFVKMSPTEYRLKNKK
jgi:AraC-like DNA-binding protein